MKSASGGRRVRFSHRKPIRLAGTLLLCLAAASAGAQAVYKCQAGRSVVYTHEPCLDAQVVDITPTQGMDKSSGTSRKGADARRIENRKIMAKAWRPLTGMDATQFEVATRRYRLDPDVRHECGRLDIQLPRHEALANAATDSAGRTSAAVLYESRKRYRRLGC